MHVPSAAFTGVQARTKLAAAEEEVPAVAALNEAVSKAKTGRKANKHDGKGSSGEASVAETEEVSAVQQGAPGTANQSRARGGTYAAVARGNEPPRDSACPQRDAQVNVHTSSTGAQQTYNANREAGNRQREGNDERYENRRGKPDRAQEGSGRRGQGNPRSQVRRTLLCVSISRASGV